MKPDTTPQIEEQPDTIRGFSKTDFITVIKRSFKLLPLAVLILTTRTAKSQTSEVGVLTGLSTFFGDLGGANDIGRPLFFDFEASEVRPVIGGIFRYNFNRHIALRNNIFYTKVGGSDKLIQPKEVYANEWFRWYRNMDFTSHIIEASSLLELNFLQYDPTGSRKNFTPFVFGGVGVFHFDPTTIYNGIKVHLHDLNTEGEGWAQYPDRKPYKLTQICIPFGFGFRYAPNPYINVGLEYGDRYTFTDYIDDVSTSYVSQAEFQQHFADDPAKADLAWALSVRSDEIDSEGIHSVTTAPGEQRGNPKNKDQYIFAYVFNFTYTLHKGGLHQFGGHHHGHLNCPIFASF